jgi:hypothetical protein
MGNRSAAPASRENCYSRLAGRPIGSLRTPGLRRGLTSVARSARWKAVAQ